jgi:predicted MFS family arabinose efflux permease
MVDALDADVGPQHGAEDRQFRTTETLADRRSIVASSLAKAGLIAAAVVSLAAMLRFDRVAPNPLLPRDAFSLRTPTGVGLWVALLLCITYSPLQIYVPIFLQRLHGLDPLAAGFTVASASLGWTAASLGAAEASGRWRDRLILAGPAVMAISLMAIAWLTPQPRTLLLVPAIVLLGIGIGQCWPLVAQRIMGGAKAGDEAIAASAVPTVMQMGFALGAAFAGLVANASGLAAGLADEGMQRGAFWVPASFVVSATLAFLAGLRLCRLRES